MHKTFLLLVLPVEKCSFSDKIAFLRKKSVRREWFVERREKTRRSQFCRIRTELIRDGAGDGCGAGDKKRTSYTVEARAKSVFLLQRPYFLNTAVTNYSIPLTFIILCFTLRGLAINSTLFLCRWYHSLSDSYEKKTILNNTRKLHTITIFFLLFLLVANY